MRIVDWATADQVARNLDQRVRELAAVPISGGRLFREIELEDGEEIAIAHGLGRIASVLISPPRGGTPSGGSSTPRVTEIRSSSYDPRIYLVLLAEDWSVDPTVDVWAF